jgi:hypothetical protein
MKPRTRVCEAQGKITKPTAKHSAYFGAGPQIKRDEHQKEGLWNTDRLQTNQTILQEEAMIDPVVFRGMPTACMDQVVRLVQNLVSRLPSYLYW